MDCCHPSTSRDDHLQQRPQELHHYATGISAGKRRAMSELPSDNSMQPLTPPTRPGSCFRCDKPGHWARDCPLKSAISNRYPVIQCQCGHGFCEIKTCKSGINQGRQYYSCPIQRGKKCSFLWCNEATPERIEARAPPYKYPECSSCFSGVCRREKEKQGPNAGRYYFACPIREGHGSCGFVMWEDEVHQGDQRILAEKLQVYETADRDSCKGDALHLERFKRMKLMDGECTAAMAASMEKGKHDETAELSTPTKSFSFPHLEIDADLSDELLSSMPLEEMIEDQIDDDLSDEVLSSVPWEEIIENKAQESRVAYSSAVRRLDVEFDELSPAVPDSPSGILSNDGCSIPNMMNAAYIPPRSEIEMEQPSGKHETTSSQEEFRELKLEVRSLKEVVAALVSLVPSHLSNVPIDGVLSAAVQQAAAASSPKVRDSHLSLS